MPLSSEKCSVSAPAFPNFKHGFDDEKFWLQSKGLIQRLGRRDAYSEDVLYGRDNYKTKKGCPEAPHCQHSSKIQNEATAA